MTIACSSAADSSQGLYVTRQASDRNDVAWRLTADVVLTHKTIDWKKSELLSTTVSNSIHTRPKSPNVETQLPAGPRAERTLDWQAYVQTWKRRSHGYHKLRSTGRRAAILLADPRSLTCICIAFVQKHGRRDLSAFPFFSYTSQWCSPVWLI